MAEPVAEMAISSELRLRVLSSAVLAPVALAVVWLGGLFLLIALLLVTGLLAREWVGLVTSPGGMSLVALLAAVGLVAAHFGIVQWALVGLVVAGVGLALAARGPLTARGLAGLGPLYIAGAGIALVLLRAVPDSGVLLIVWLLAVIWATDIGAYFAGRGIGGRKLAAWWPGRRSARRSRRPRRSYRRSWRVSARRFWRLSRNLAIFSSRGSNDAPRLRIRAT